MRGTAIVTGASGGIGSAITSRLCAQQYRVIAVGTRHGALDALASRTGCETRVLDITDPVQIEKSLEDFQADILVHAAGVLGPQLPIYETPTEVVSTIIATNVVGTLNLIRTVVPSMKRKGKGTIILLGSICGNVPGSGPGVYAASKAALQAIATNLRYDLLGSLIRVSEIRLGRVRTGIHNQLEASEDFYAGYECIMPENVADTVVHILDSPQTVDLSLVEIMPTLQVVGGTHFAKE